MICRRGERGRSTVHGVRSRCAGQWIRCDPGDSQRPDSRRVRQSRRDRACVRSAGVPGRAIRGTARSRPALASAAATDALGRHLSRRSYCAGMHSDPARARHQSLLRRRSDERRLPVSEHLGAAAPCRRVASAGRRLDLWRRFHDRLGVDGELQRRAARIERRRLCRPGISRRCARLPRACGPQRRVAAACVGQLRIPGSDRGAAVDPAEHRALRRRPRQRHDHGAVRGFGKRIGVAGESVEPGPVPPRRRHERRRPRREHGPGTAVERRRAMGARAANDSEGAIADGTSTAAG